MRAQSGHDALSVFLIGQSGASAGGKMGDVGGGVRDIYDAESYGGGGRPSIGFLKGYLNGRTFLPSPLSNALLKVGS